MKYRITKDEDLKFRIQCQDWGQFISNLLICIITIPFFGLGFFGLAVLSTWDYPKESRGKSFNTKEEAEQFTHNNIIRECHYIEA